MTPTEIILIVLGIIIIIISCRIVDKSNTKAIPRNPLNLEQQLSEDDIIKIKDKMNELLSEVSEETVIKTDDYLSKISNEKIMAVSEFTDQIMEKIKRNHEEVVFLYNMLNDKEKDLKDAMKDIASSTRKLQENNISTNRIASNENEEIDLQLKSMKTKAIQLKEEYQSTSESSDTFSDISIETNNNAKILSLHSQGNSILEISKQLDLGQGEVKLVIDLSNKGLV